MKTIRQSTCFMMALAFSAALISCKPNQEKVDEHAGHDHGDDTETPATANASAPQFEVSSEFQKQLSEVFANYVLMKDAFVTSDASKVKTESKKVSDALAKVDMKLVEGVAHNDWMTHLDPMQKSLAAIQSADDIEAQRKEFSVVSGSLYKSIKAFGLGGKEAFYDFCPMAFNNEGGYWLSDNDQIRNPYFGDAMLTCGSVQEKLN
jgi:hypothetical protein